MRQESQEERAIRLQRRRRVTLPTLVLVAVFSLVLGIVITIGLLVKTVGVDGLSVVQAMSVVRSSFVGEYDWHEVTDKTMNGMVNALDDQWSYFLTQGQYLQLQESRSNSYVGIGVTISTQEQDAIYITAVANGGPAQAAGILAGEAVVEVDHLTVTEDNWEEMVEQIAGESGTIVTLTIRDESETLRTLEVMRREIYTDPVAFEMLYGEQGEKIGYIQLQNFYTGSADAMKNALEKLEEAGAESLLIDVRGNPGGYVTELTEMLDALLPEGTIFISHDINGKETVYTSDAQCYEMPMAVLVDSESYSAAEFLAAQLREAADAAVVGEQTSGKGYAQQLFPLRNGSAMGISTSRYVTGSGVSLVGVGLHPEPEITLDEEERRLFRQGELSYEEDPQMQAAIAILIGKM